MCKPLVLQDPFSGSITSLCAHSAAPGMPKTASPGRARDEDAVDLARPDQRLLEQLALRILPAVEQPVALALAQRNRRRRPCGDRRGVG